MSAQQKTSALAVVALVMAFLCAPIGLILGIIAFVRINNSNDELAGKGIAIAAMVIPVALVPVIGIFAAIFIPNFIEFQLRAKTTEAHIQLGNISRAQEGFKVKYGSYAPMAPTVATVPGKSKTPPPARPCPTDCNQGAIQRCNEASCIGFDTSLPMYYQYECNATKDAFACAAVGDLDGDDQQAVFVYGSGADSIEVPLPAITRGACAAALLANEVIDCTPGVY